MPERRINEPAHDTDDGDDDDVSTTSRTNASPLKPRAVNSCASPGTGACHELVVAFRACSEGKGLLIARVNKA